MHWKILLLKALNKELFMVCFVFPDRATTARAYFNCSETFLFSKHAAVQTSIFFPLLSLDP